MKCKFTNLCKCCDSELTINQTTVVQGLRKEVKNKQKKPLKSNKNQLSAQFEQRKGMPSMFIFDSPYL